MSSEEHYDYVRKILSNHRSIRAFVRECNFEWLEEVSQKLIAAIDERRADYEAEKMQLVEREKQRQELLNLIHESGFDIESLAMPVDAMHPKVKGKKKPSGIPRKPKYQYTENGEIKTWNGVGRKPKFLTEALDAGRSLDEFLIPNQD